MVSIHLLNAYEVTHVLTSYRPCASRLAEPKILTTWGHLGKPLLVPEGGEKESPGMGLTGTATTMFRLLTMGCTPDRCPLCPVSPWVLW